MVGFLEVVSVGATVISMGMLASPILTMMTLAKAKSIGALTIVFFVAQFVNCCVWSLYGVQKGAVPVILCNSIGTAIATYCVLTFLSIARVEERSGKALTSTTYAATLRTALIGFFTVVSAMVLILVLMTFAGLGLSSQVNGIMGGFCSVFMLSSPLGMASSIIKNKNAAPLQPVTLILGTLNSILWTLYGILTVDIYVGLPNGLCTAACFFQVFLLVRYGRRFPDEEPADGPALAELPID